LGTETTGRGSLSPAKQALLDRRLRQLDATQKIGRRAKGGAAPLSFAQQLFWILEQLSPGNAFRHSSLGIRFAGPLDCQALHKALCYIVGRHEILRTVFSVRGEEPIQTVGPAGSFPMETVDLRALSMDKQQEEFKKLAKAQVEQPFDLKLGPLYRATLVGFALGEHVLLLTFHHIVFDGWSFGVLLRELTSCYDAFHSSGTPALPELEIQYADFAQWQHDWFKGEVLERDLSYWKAQLADLQPAELPFDRPRSASPRHRGNKISLAVPTQTAAVLQELTRASGMTFFVTLLSAFMVLFSRYTRCPEAVVGCPVANRARPEVEGLIGPFTNTLVLRASLAGDPTFTEFLARVYDVTMEAIRHQAMPFEVLVEKLQPERSLSVNPFFQVMFALQNSPVPAVSMGETKCSLLPLHGGGSDLDLFLEALETSAGLECNLIYDSDLFDASTAHRFLNCFEVILQSITAAPHQRISDLNVMPLSLRHQMLIEWNHTPAAAGMPPSIYERFLAQAARTPAGIAVVDGDERMTYDDLRCQAGVLGRRLRSLGVASETLVAILMDRTAEMLVAVFGVLASGAGYVPLDPAYPRERLAYMLEDSGARVLLTQSHLLEILPNPKAHVVLMNPGQELDHGIEIKEATPGNVAYVLYTSGSTGRPKGVAVQHRNTSAFVQWALTAFQQQELTAVLASTSLCFDLSVFEIFTPLSCGGAVVLARDALALPELPAAHTVTLINTVPSVMAELLTLTRISDSVKTVSLCGERLARSLADRIYKLSSATRVVNLYGPTESTTYSTYIDVPRTSAGEPPIGRPIDGTQVYVLDDNLREAPVGVYGELFLGGAGLARGYVGLPAATAEKFVPSPFSDVPGSRLYASGDVARFLSDGQLEFLGRRDNQVKVRGFRIELGEVECALLKHSAVAEAAVLARGTQPDGVRLVAYVAAHPKMKPDAEELRDFLGAWLPAHAVPSAFVFLPTLPRTPNGKINRRALPEPEIAQTNSGFVEPSTLAEKLLAQIWSEVLKLEHIGIHDHFFRIGGHSLLATRVVARLRNVLQLELPLQSIFEAPTIARLAPKLEQLLEQQAIASSHETPEGLASSQEQA
jgi:amino acid adenylation domain-containing protein